MAMTENDIKMVNRLQKNLSAIRKLAGWTVREFADRCNVSPQTILNWEADTSKKTYKEITMGHYWMIISAIGAEMSHRGDADLFTKAVNILLSESADEKVQAENELKINGIANAIKGGANEETIETMVDSMQLNNKAVLGAATVLGAAAAPVAAVAIPGLIIGLMAQFISDKGN